MYVHYKFMSLRIFHADIYSSSSFIITVAFNFIVWILIYAFSYLWGFRLIPICSLKSAAINYSCKHVLAYLCKGHSRVLPTGGMIGCCMCLLSTLVDNVTLFSKVIVQMYTPPIVDNSSVASHSHLIPIVARFVHFC